MGDDGGNSTQRAIGQLEGRIAAMEARQAEAESRHVRENAELRAAQAAMNAKLDQILAQLNQGVGGLRVAVVIGGVIGSVAAFLAAKLWPLLPK